MKHYIDLPSGSTQFREAFCLIRDAFLSLLSERVGSRLLVKYQAQSRDGNRVEWVRSMSTAKQFIAGMVDDGFCVAFRGVKTRLGTTVQISYWENPEVDPGFPQKGIVLFEEWHEGVMKGRPPTEQGAQQAVEADGPASDGSAA